MESWQTFIHFCTFMGNLEMRICTHCIILNVIKSARCCENKKIKSCEIFTYYDRMFRFRNVSHFIFNYIIYSASDGNSFNCTRIIQLFMYWHFIVSFLHKAFFNFLFLILKQPQYLFKNFRGCAAQCIYKKFPRPFEYFSRVTVHSVWNTVAKLKFQTCQH